MKLSFDATILAEIKDIPRKEMGGMSITSVIAKLKRGEFDIELPQFIHKPLIILREK
jgi:hypothetical protein